MALPALFVDLDQPDPEALDNLRAFVPCPSCIVASGHGFHAYWWLDHSLQDLTQGRALLRALAQQLSGDAMTPAQSLRLPGSFNTKSDGEWALCHILEKTDQRYPITAFDSLIVRPVRDHRSNQPRTSFSRPALTEEIVAALRVRGGRWRSDWINASCPFPERHHHGDRHPSFGFNARTGYGFCHVCGTLLLRDLVPALNLTFA